MCRNVIRGYVGHAVHVNAPRSVDFLPITLRKVNNNLGIVYKQRKGRKKKTKGEKKRGKFYTSSPGHFHTFQIKSVVTAVSRLMQRRDTVLHLTAFYVVDFTDFLKSVALNRYYCLSLLSIFQAYRGYRKSIPTPHSPSPTLLSKKKLIKQDQSFRGFFSL